MQRSVHIASPRTRVGQCRDRSKSLSTHDLRRRRSGGLRRAVERTISRKYPGVQFDMRRILLAAVFVLTACGDSLGPVQTPTNAMIAGTWRFTFTEMAGDVDGEAFVCDAVMDFTITQSRGAFTGDQLGEGELVCTYADDIIIDEPIEGETIIDGEISGRTIAFRMGSVAGAHNGSVAGSGVAMAGTAEWIFDGGLALEGTFTAARQ
jgi:hypothetical protein